MEEFSIIKSTIDFIQSIGFIGLLIILAIPKLRNLIFGSGELENLKKLIKTLDEKIKDDFGKEFKNEENVQKQIEALQEHAKIANEEMGEIQKDIAVIKTQLKFISESIKK